MEQLKYLKDAPVLHGKMYTESECISIYENLKELSWVRDEYFIYGKMRKEGRDTFFSGDDGVKFKYGSNIRIGTGHASVIDNIQIDIIKYLFSVDTKDMDENAKETLELAKTSNYNGCYCNFYNDGNDFIGMHSDKIVSQKHDLVVTVSFGATRDFVFCNKESKYRKVIPLESGDIVIMGNNCQKYYKHGIPKRLRCKDGRISLTFRVLI
jgi:hypothetical protein